MKKLVIVSLAMLSVTCSYSQTYLPLSGGTLTGPLVMPSAEVTGIIRSSTWMPSGSTSDDFFIDVEPGTRTLRTRNWNTGSPNIAVTGIHTGSGLFENNVQVNGNVTVGTSALAGTTPPTNIFSLNGFRINGNLSAAGQNALSYQSGGGGGAAISFYRGGGYDTGIDFYTNSINVSGSITHRLRIDPAGNVGIGTASPDSKLTVAGKIHSQEVKVTTTTGADFVFEDDYKLRSLAETEDFIRQNKHLPEVAPADEMIKNGIDLGAMNIKLLQKIEELTLYLIGKDKQVTDLQERVKRLEGK